MTKKATATMIRSADINYEQAVNEPTTKSHKTASHICHIHNISYIVLFILCVSYFTQNYQTHITAFEILFDARFRNHSLPLGI